MKREKLSTPKPTPKPIAIFITNDNFQQYHSSISEYIDSTGQKFLSKTPAFNADDPACISKLLAKTSESSTFNIFGPSGSGKTCLIYRILKYFAQFQNTRYQGVELGINTIVDLNSDQTTSNKIGVQERHHTLKFFQQANIINVDKLDQMIASLQIQPAPFNKHSSRADAAFTVLHDQTQFLTQPNDNVADYEKFMEVHVKKKIVSINKNYSKEIQKKQPVPALDNTKRTLHLLDIRGPEQNIETDSNYYACMSAFKKNNPQARSARLSLMKSIKLFNPENQVFLILVAPRNNENNSFYRFIQSLDNLSLKSKKSEILADQWRGQNHARGQFTPEQQMIGPSAIIKEKPLSNNKISFSQNGQSFPDALTAKKLTKTKKQVKSQFKEFVKHNFEEPKQKKVMELYKVMYAIVNPYKNFEPPQTRYQTKIQNEKKKIEMNQPAN